MAYEPRLRRQSAAVTPTGDTMKSILPLIAALALATPAWAQTTGHDHDHGGAAPTAVASPQGSGIVKAVNAKDGTVTVHHGPIAALGWPAMTMTFKAAPEVLKAAKPGATVTFTLNAAGDQIVAIN
jgi:Cu(I)/Ag(I) efflux system protein CusF